MTIPMAWLIAGMLMLTAAAVWLAGPWGLLTAGAVVVTLSVVLLPSGERP